MEKKNLYREYFPGYMGHIPFKYEVIGMTVGATNNYIKSNTIQIKSIPHFQFVIYNSQEQIIPYSYIFHPIQLNIHIIYSFTMFSQPFYSTYHSPSLL